MASISIGEDIAGGTDDHVEMSARIVEAEAGDIKKFAQKITFEVALLSTTVSGIWASGNIPSKASEEKSHAFLSTAYALVSIITFLMGMLLLLFSVLLPRVPRLVGVAKKLTCVAFVLFHVALGLKMSIHALCCFIWDRLAC